MSQRNGAAFEKYLDTLHANYRRAGLAHLVHVPTPVCITGTYRGKVQGHLRTPVYVDYTGVLSGGIAVALEAKYTQGGGPSFPLSKISPGQRDVLTSVHHLGGVSALIVRHGMIGAKGMLASSDYLIPTAYIDSLERKSFRWDAVEMYRIPAGSTWIDALCDEERGKGGDWHLYTRFGWAWKADNRD